MLSALKSLRTPRSKDPVLTISDVQVMVMIAAQSEPNYSDEANAVIYKCRSLVVEGSAPGRFRVLPFEIAFV